VNISCPNVESRGRCSPATRWRRARRWPRSVPRPIGGTGVREALPGRDRHRRGGRGAPRPARTGSRSSTRCSEWPSTR
jgi:hypothetical protein